MNKVTALQTAILSLYVVVTSCHMLLVYATLSRTGSASHPFVCLEVLSILMVTLSWVGVMAVDPSVDTKQDGYFSFSKPTCSLVRHLQVPTSRYCAICAQNTLGMDHHCLWLNCCIGRRNYQSFLLLSLSLVFQMLLQSVFALYALIEGVLRNNMTYLNAADAFSGSNLFILEILLAIDVIVSVVVLVFLASLVFFHMYLICIRKTSTFEWVMRRRYKVGVSLIWSSLLTLC